MRIRISTDEKEKIKDAVGLGDKHTTTTNTHTDPAI